MKINLLRQLADKYFYYNYQLTLTEYKQLKNSKFSIIFESKPYNSKNILTETTETTKPTKPTKPFHFNGYYIGVEEDVITDLTQQIDDKFKLGVEHSMYGVSQKAPVEELKEFIEDYKKANLMQEKTKDFINKLLKFNNTLGILNSLYNYMDTIQGTEY